MHHFECFIAKHIRVSELGSPVQSHPHPHTAITFDPFSHSLNALFYAYFIDVHILKSLLRSFLNGPNFGNDFSVAAVV